MKITEAIDAAIGAASRLKASMPLLFISLYSILVFVGGGLFVLWIFKFLSDI